MQSHNRAEENNDEQFLKETTAFLQKFFKQPDLNPKRDNSSETKVILLAINMKKEELNLQRSSARNAAILADKCIQLKVQDHGGQLHGAREPLDYYQAKKVFFEREKCNLESDINKLEVAAAVLKK